MSFSNYQPAAWAGNQAVPTTVNYDGQGTYGNEQDYDDGRVGSQDARYPPGQDQNYRYHRGRRCRWVCDPLPPRPPNPRFIARQLPGLRLLDAQRRFPGANIRVVIRNGQQLQVTLDYNPNRINVETSTRYNGEVILRVVGFY